ncbi:AlpA family phage regulatory protein [Martelella sp. AD-3]|uniref:helix-turn-helix transcriptional regulator n=1 Tax=Martelella sp. AD-3 TaxID=686597 RepID=UPI000463062E|nr:AlpA family phage regulatory protein [Martelella sp. AD-3]AMM84138.1 hypothetical protein AZF01_07020 [Martelella sp. AD-3]
MEPNKEADEIRFLSLAQVCEMTSLSRTQINNYRNDGRFPQAVPLGMKRLAFVKAEVVAWMEKRIAERLNVQPRPRDNA